MTPAQIKKKVLSYGDWEFFLERPFKAFYMTLFAGGNSRETMREIGADVEHEAWLFEEGCWWQSNSVYEKAARDIAKEIPKGLSIIKVSQDCERFRINKKKQILRLITARVPVLDKFREVVHILKINTAYIWLAHDFEHYYAPILKKEIPKYFTGNIDTLIGDLSFPDKKNSHNFFEEELRTGAPLKELVAKYGWMKVRDGFSEPYTEDEFKELKKNLPAKPAKEMKKIDLPKDLKPIINEVRELVYFRTLRTDVFYELMFLARPIVIEVAELYGLKFQELSNYSAYDLMVGKLKKHPDLVSCACYKNEFTFFNKPILPKRDLGDKTIKGNIAYKGKATGLVKIVKNVGDLSKVNVGDILVTHMTSPNYLTAMQKAAAFVTDEGGITCHAAIVAREMKKPCIIGTKIATKVLHDGDLVEVDADKGVVHLR